jgi:hypothetical protein
MVKVTCQVNSYDDPAKQSLMLHNHWNDSNMVVLKIDEIEITVKAKELKAAIDNCTNTAKFY